MHAVLGSWVVRGASLRSAFALRPGAPRMRDPLRLVGLKEPLPTSNRPLTPLVAFRAPSFRLQPIDSLRFAFANPYPIPLSQSLAGLLHPFRQSHLPFPTKGNLLAEACVRLEAPSVVSATFGAIRRCSQRTALKASLRCGA